ncbi:MAG: phage integrase N-terminal SAM-like domain-containing protein, partial [Planctomycetia bacterium]
MVSRPVKAAPRPNRPLLDQIRDALRERRMSYRTEQAYVQWAKRFILHFGDRCAEDLGPV